MHEVCEVYFQVHSKNSQIVQNRQFELFWHGSDMEVQLKIYFSFLC